MTKSIFALLIFVFSGLAFNVYAQDNGQAAATWNKQAQNAYEKVVHFSNKDSLSYYRSVFEGVKAILKCYDADNSPNNKEKAKRKYEAQNIKRYQTLYPKIIDGGIYMCKDVYTRPEGLAMLKLYIDNRNHELSQMFGDESGVAAYYLAYYYLQSRSFQLAEQYADIALTDDETALLGAEIKAECMYHQMKTQEDSLKYLAVISKLYETVPTSKEYFAWIMRFYQKPTPRFNIERFIDAQLEENPNSPVPWILKAEIAMTAKRWDEAIEAYTMANELEPSNIPVIFNTGVCLNMKGLEERHKYLEKKKNGSFASEDDYKNIFALSRSYLERVSIKDPQRKIVDWVMPLLTVYNMLEDKVKAEELEQLNSKFK